MVGEERKRESTFGEEILSAGAEFFVISHNPGVIY